MLVVPLFCVEVQERPATEQRTWANKFLPAHRDERAHDALANTLRVLIEMDLLSNN